MFVFDIFKSEARRLRTLSIVVAAGMLALLGGLWFVQIVSGKRMEGKLEVQSFRSPQVPAQRGRILDRNGLALVENHPQYNAVLYLEELRSQFTNEYFSHVLKEYVREHPGSGAGRLPPRITLPLRLEANYRVVSNITYEVGTALEQPMTLNRERFWHFYTDYTFMPLQILTNLNARQVAIFSEKLSGLAGLDLERQPVVNYPHKTTAAHLLGYVVRTGEDRKYLPPGYKGATGIEAAFDGQLKGRPGTNLVLVNNEGYRQRTETLAANQAGEDVYLTISLPLQEAAEAALFGVGGAGVRGAAVVMDVHTGELLALASSPTFDPNEFVSGVSPARWEQLNDARLQPQLNRATYDAYPPGSTFKIITTLACLESGVMDVNEPFMVPADPEDPRHGAFMEQGYHIKDTAPPGEYKFENAFFHSSNTYFSHYGMKVGLRKLLEVARRFHLGEKTGFAIAREEVAGNVPLPEQAGKTMLLNSAPYVAIGQEITVTPLQMTVLIAAIANGGIILRPRLVSGARSLETGEVEELDPVSGPRDQVHIDPRHLQILRNAMLQDTEHPGANGYDAFHGIKAGRVLEDAHFQVAGKTGTAQVNSPGLDYRDVTWFDSYGPFNDPRYAVVVMVVGGGSGGTTCAPVARKIYEAIVTMESKGALQRALTRN
jgi:penicillin-binding protein 2